MAYEPNGCACETPCDCDGPGESRAFKRNFPNPRTATAEEIYAALSDPAYEQWCKDNGYLGLVEDEAALALEYRRIEKTFRQEEDDDIAF